MAESHRIAVGAKHYPLPSAPLHGEIVMLDGKAYGVEVGLREYIGNVAYVTWRAVEIPARMVDPNLTRARD